jgi:hypothetical protein
MTNELAFVGRINALGPPIAAYHTPLRLQEVQAVAGIATTIGVLIALYIAAIREPRKDAAERRHHAAQIDALRRAEQARIAAQARKVLPSCVRTPMFGDASWTVRIDNASDAVATILGVYVAALDTNGFEIPHGCSRIAGMVPVDQVFDRSIRAALYDLSQGRFEHELVPSFKQAVRDAMVGHFVNEWPRTMPPNQHAVMAYTTTDPNYKLRITIDYEDEAGYQWRRTDTSQPRRTDNQPQLGTANELWWRLDRLC